MSEYSYMKKYCSKTLNAKILGKLLNMQRDALLKKNKEEVNFYSKFIDKAIHQLMNNTNGLPLKFKYRVQKLKFYLETINKSISDYFAEKKKSILFESITK